MCTIIVHGLSLDGPSSLLFSSSLFFLTTFNTGHCGITFVYPIFSMTFPSSFGYRLCSVFVFVFFVFNFNVLHLFYAPAIIGNEIVCDYQRRHHHQVQVQIIIKRQPPMQHSMPPLPPPLHDTEITQTKFTQPYSSAGNGAKLRVLTETKAKESGGMCARLSPRKQFIQPMKFRSGTKQ